MLKEKFAGDCDNCAPWCDDACRNGGPRFSLADGPINGMPASPRMLYSAFDPADFLDDPDRVIMDDDYTREHLASGEKLLARCGNWNLVFKAKPYGAKDLMIMVDKTEGSPVVGIEDVLDDDLYDLLVIIGYLREKFAQEYPESEFVFGLNRGANQSLKRIHLHVTDISEAIEPSEEKVRAHVQARVASTRRPFKATVEVARVVQGIITEAYLDNSTIKIPLRENDEDIQLLKTLGTRLTKALSYLDEGYGKGNQWCYSMLFEEEDGQEFVRAVFFDRPVGTTDVVGVALARYEGEPTEGFIAERQCLKEFVGTAIEEIGGEKG